jgi:ATP-dependent RNA helicase DeaD
MLRMGFIEDVETIMAQIPEGHQTALFSPPCRKRFVALPAAL